MKKQHTIYHKDGSIYGKGELEGDKMEGFWEFFRKDGSKMRSGTLVNGKQVGEWTTFDKSGKVVKISNFDKK